MRAAVIALLLAFGVTGCGSESEQKCETPVVDAGFNGCGPANCAGCCFDNQCYAGNVKEACGSAGNLCKPCGEFQRCSTAQACEMDPSSEWGLKPINLTLNNDNNGAPWDTDSSAPDPYVVFNNQPDYKWGPIANSLAPSFDIAGTVILFKADILMNAGVRVEVLDDDAPEPAQVIGQARFIKLSLPDFERKAVSLENWGGLQQANFKIFSRAELQPPAQ